MCGLAYFKHALLTSRFLSFRLYGGMLTIQISLCLYPLFPSHDGNHRAKTLLLF